MTFDQTLRAALDELVPARPAPEGWDDIAAAAERKHLMRALTRPRMIALLGAVLVAGLALLVLSWPFGNGPRGTVLEQAAAAIGDGPVLHVVVQNGFGGKQIDLATGSSKIVHEVDEYWFDPQRGVHEISRFAGVVQGDSTYPPGRVGYLDKTLTFLATDYRSALQNGTARVLGRATLGSDPVFWIRVDTQELPDSSDGKLHAWAHDVAVSTETLKPVATRETRDGALSPDGVSSIDSIETLPAGEGDFSASGTHGNAVAMRYERTGSLTAAEARAVLGGRLLTAGEQLDGLPLSRISKDTRTEGSMTHVGVTLFYGQPSGGGIGTPPPAGPYVQIAEATSLDDQFQRGVIGYSPPDGTILVFGTTIGVMQSHGIHVALEGSSEQLLLAAARALRP